MAPVDYLILAPLDLEIKALRAAFNAQTVDPRSYADGTEYWAVTVPREHGQDPATIHIAQLKAQGVLNAAVTATRLLEEARPACIVSFGIAGGFIKTKDSDVELCDVVVADQPVIYYEPAKEGKRPEARILPLPIDVHATSEFIKLCRDLPQGYFLRHGPIASGEKLLNSSDAPSAAAIKAVSGKALAVEMEAAGIAAAGREAAAANRHCRVLVVKGVSDDAQNKDASVNARSEAAQHAATLLSAFVKTFLLERSDDIPYPVSGLRSQAELFCEELKPWVSPNKPLDPIAVCRVLYPLNQPPALFYRWTLLHPHLHWVDFHFLLILRRLMTAGLKFKAHLTVDDTRSQVSETVRDRTAEIVDLLLLGGANVHWYSKTQACRAKYAGFAQANGFDEVALNELRHRYSNEKKTTLPGGKDGFSMASDWLQYVGWLSRHENRCIVLHWDAHADTVQRFLQHFVTLSPLVIHTPDLKLAGKLGKTQHPGKDLVIDPPHYSSILTWLDSAPSPLAIEELVKHLDVEPHSAEDNEITIRFEKLLLTRETLRQQLDSTDIFAIAVTKLVRLLAWWNYKYFERESVAQ